MYNEEDTKNTELFAYYVGVRFISSERSYFFGTNLDYLKMDDPVVVETIRGKELCYVSTPLMDIRDYKSQLPLKPILRKATESDINGARQNIKDADEALKLCAEAVEDLGLKMNLISSEYTLDKSKITIYYIAEQRVDFRELLKILASQLRTRIELHQIGSRDKAKLIGGIGICGLPLCCSTFLNEFDGISINRAKNQMLAINIPKLSGHCGKLVCCLKYEDEAYTEAKKEFPPIGEHITVEGVNYRVGSYNVISKTVKLDSDNDIKFISLEEYKNIKKAENSKKK
ncbi:MAG: stage 0 sporulation protein [Erysipelotrichaceae bacterium]|jgi:cell fate regulator YaaT (PSP1 superfamily)|nr:stage 0 sporulation protein [Erysipelotrichaceae bacterium]